ncbi:MAG: class I SAM-dependent RNA methyltransferase [Gemmatimonadetes bacterium]|nr:class I SAM-dependent RNA methyltransferase [Gemmatimonadota bacterium]
MTVVSIARIGAGGDGVGRLPDGMVVFVPRTAPGDEAEVEIVETRKRHAYGRLRGLVRPGADRVEPECPHYTADRCGGCQLQHLTVPAQVQAKAGIVGEALRRIGRHELHDPDVIPAPAPWRYRAKITLAVSGKRIGLHRYDAPGTVFSLEDCRITREPLMRLWSVVREHRALLPGALEELVLREDRDGGLHLVAAGGGEPWDAGPLAAAVGLDGVAYWWRPAGGAARIVAGARTGFPALAFEQVNPELAARMREDAVEELGDVRGQVVWDLYGGVGDAARLLAARGARVFSVDRDRAAIAWARQRAGAGQEIEWFAGLVEETLHRLPEPDAVVANPPRAGLAARVSAALQAWGQSRPGARLCYVSCDPATLARDLTRLPAFSVPRVRAYDLFPHTSHVETLAVLRRG